MISNVRFEESPILNKKYRVHFTYNGKTYKVDFGDKRYQHYKDRTPLKLYSHQDHLDKTRRRSYLSRAGGIMDKRGKLTKNNPMSPNYWSIRKLW